MTTSSTRAPCLKLELPRADGPASRPAGASVEHPHQCQGRYFVGDREVLRTDVESLKQSLRDVAGDDRDRTVLIRADARTPWQAVITAYEALGQPASSGSPTPPLAGCRRARPEPRRSERTRYVGDLSTPAPVRQGRIGD